MSQTASTTWTTRSDTCDDCGGTVRDDGIDAYCTDCGLVVGEPVLRDSPTHQDGHRQQARRCGSPNNPLHHDDDLGSTFDPRAGGRRLSRLKRRHKRARQPTKRARAQAFANGAIQRVAAGLSLPEDVAVRATQLFATAQANDLLTGSAIETYVGASLHAACREAHQARRLEEIAAELRLTDDDVQGDDMMTDLRTAYSALCREASLTPKPPSVVAHLQRTLGTLETTADADIPAKTAVRATRLADAADDCPATGGHAPSVLAAACLAIAVDEHVVGISQTAIATAAGRSTRALHLATNTLEDADLPDNV